MTNPSGMPPAHRAAGERQSLDRPEPQAPQARPAREEQSASPVAAARANAGGGEKRGLRMPKIGNPLTWLFNTIDERLPEERPGFVNGKTIVGLVIFLIGLSILVLGALGSSPTSAPVQVTMPTPRPAAPSSGEPVLGFTVEGPEQVRVNASLTLATVFVVLLILFGFAETIGRRERFALDFWAPIMFVLVAVFRAQMIRDLWLILQTAASCAVAFAIALNENRPVGKTGGNVWSQIFNLITGALDMTPLYVGAALMLALKYAAWAIMPYPLWIPIQVVWVALIFGSLFELSRVPLPSLLAIGLGAAAGFLFNPWVTAIAALVVVAMGAIFAQVGWLPKTRHENSGAVEAMGHSLNMTLRWDLVIMAVIAFFLVAIGVHGDVVLWTIMAR